jgi:hypothetical protein
MYSNHAPLIKKYAEESADNLADVILMVVLSIQQPWHTVGTQMKDVQEHKQNSKFLWGNKRKTYSYLSRRRGIIFGQYKAIINGKKTDKEKAIALMKLFMQVDGLGAVKAGFVCQLTAGLVGCIDLHNVKLYRIDAKVLKISTKIKSKELYTQKITDYVELCHNIGTEKLWDAWCEHLANQKNRFQDAMEVSKAHIDYLFV